MDSKSDQTINDRIRHSIYHTFNFNIYPFYKTDDWTNYSGSSADLNKVDNLRVVDFDFN